MLFYITTVRINIPQEVMDPVLAQATKLMMSRLRRGRVGCVLLSTYVDWYVQQRYYHDHQFAHNLLTLDPQPRK